MFVLFKTTTGPKPINLALVQFPQSEDTDRTRLFMPNGFVDVLMGYDDVAAILMGAGKPKRASCKPSPAKIKKPTPKT